MSEAIEFARGAAFREGYDSAIESSNGDINMLLERIANIEAERDRMRSIVYDTAHIAATLGSGSDGWLRGRFMSISNALNAAIGRTQSSHGDQFDETGIVVKSDPINE